MAVIYGCENADSVGIGPGVCRGTAEASEALGTAGVYGKAFEIR